MAASSHYTYTPLSPSTEFLQLSLPPLATPIRPSCTFPTSRDSTRTIYTRLSFRHPRQCQSNPSTMNVFNGPYVPVTLYAAPSTLLSPLATFITPPPSYHAPSPTASAYSSPQFDRPLFSEPARPTNLGNGYVEGSFFPRQPPTPPARPPRVQAAQPVPPRQHGRATAAIPAANHRSNQMSGRPAQVGPTGFMDYQDDDEAIVTKDELDSFLRASDSGRYPDINALRLQDPAPNDRRRWTRPADNARNTDQIQRAVTNPNAGVNPYRNGQSRLGGLRLRIRSLSSNRLPTVSSHNSQEGSNSTAAATAIPISGTPNRSALEDQSPEIIRLHRTVRLRGNPRSSVPTVSHHRSSYTPADLPTHGSTISTADSARIQSHRSNTTRTRSNAISEHTPNASSQSAGSGRTSVSVRSIRYDISNITTRHQRGPAPSVGSRPPTPRSKDTPRSLKHQDAPPYTAMDTFKEKEDEKKSHWVLYDENGEVKKVWALEYSSNKHQGKKEAGLPTYSEGVRKIDSTSGVKKQIRGFTAQSSHPSTVSARTRSTRLVRAVSLPSHRVLNPADPLQSDASSSRITQTSEEVANCLGLFEAQEVITALESQRDNLRRHLREQQNVMMTMPHHLIEGAMRERVDMKKVLQGVDVEIRGWQETVACLRSAMAEE